MGINFPNAPVNGQVYPLTPTPGLPQYVWDAAASAWILKSDGLGPTIYVSDTAPPGAIDGALWWSSTDGILYLRFNDGDSVAWVQCAPSAADYAALFAYADTKIKVIKVRRFTATGPYVPDTNMVQAGIECVGGGGAGGSTTATAAGQASVSIGGGGGGYAYALVTKAQVGASQTVTIGPGGVQVAAGATGGNGGTTSVGALCSAAGGAGGVGGGAAAAVYGNGANGGGGSIGDVMVEGGASSAAMGITAPNPNGIPSHGGHAARGFGAGGRGILNSTGENGKAYGGGGGGTITGASTAAYGGGAGAAGVAVITEYCTA